MLNILTQYLKSDPTLLFIITNCRSSPGSFRFQFANAYLYPLLLLMLSLNFKLCAKIRTPHTLSKNATINAHLCLYIFMQEWYMAKQKNQGKRDKVYRRHSSSIINYRHLRSHALKAPTLQEMSRSN